MQADLDLRPAAELFRALADETRLRIVALLSNGELCVCHIQHALGLPQPSVSRQLAILRAAGVVAARRKGTWVHYRLLPQEDPERARQLRALTQGFTRDAVLRRDVEKLQKTLGPGQCDAGR